VSERRYRLYGLAVRSDLALPAAVGEGPCLGVVSLDAGPEALGDTTPVSTAADDWFVYRRLGDGAEYLRWRGLFEFVVAADGGHVACRALPGATDGVLHTYLLGQVLSFALLKQGIEPLHATAVLVGGGAIGFLGDCGYGKSTTAAAFLAAGHRLLTDDLLVVSASGSGVLAHPGPARIKLFPEPARALLGERALGTPMNGETDKLVIPLDGEPASAAPLRALYVLGPPTRARRAVTIRRLSPRRAFVELLRASFNVVVVEPARLARQFELAAWLSTSVPIKRLSFPRTLASLAAVREAVEADLAA
jgi:hypothetical protein